MQIAVDVEVDSNRRLCVAGERASDFFALRRNSHSHRQDGGSVKAKKEGISCISICSRFNRTFLIVRIEEAI